MKIADELYSHQQDRDRTLGKVRARDSAQGRPRDVKGEATMESRENLALGERGQRTAANF